MNISQWGQSVVKSLKRSISKIIEEHLRAGRSEAVYDYQEGIIKQLPPPAYQWAKPNSKEEADALLIKIKYYLLTTEEDSFEREVALKNIFMLSSYLDLSRTHITALQDILRSYGQESVRPILLAVSKYGTAEVFDAAVAILEVSILTEKTNS